MSRDELREASEVLEGATEATEDASLRDRLRDQATQLASLAERDQEPDHGRIARHQGVLRDIKADAGGALDEDIDEANALLGAYRETLEGV